MKRWILPLLAQCALNAPGAIAQDSERRPPFITTPDAVVTRMLALAGTGPQDTVFDLGSGDGRIVIAAARQFGARGHGIELEPHLVARSRDYARQAGVEGRVGFEQGDVLVADLSRATVVTLYLLPFLIDRLQPRLLGELKPGTRIVSHAFSMVGWQPDRQETVKVATPHPGQGDTSVLYLWVVPAEVRGPWSSQGGVWQLRIHQSYQQIEIEGTRRGRPIAAREARLSGSELAWRDAEGEFRGRLEHGRIAGEFTSQGRSNPVLLLRPR